MIQKLKEKLSNLDCNTVSYFIFWLGVLITFIGLCVDAFYTLGPITGGVFFGVVLMIVGAITMIL